MIFMIIAASNTFSAILAFTGATAGLLDGRKADLSPFLLLICMQIVIFMLGTFMETISIMMICLPIFMPIAKLLGFDPVWFGVIMLINFEMGLITPPFGMLLFVMKGVAPARMSAWPTYASGSAFYRLRDAGHRPDRRVSASGAVAAVRYALAVRSFFSLKVKH